MVTITSGIPVPENDGYIVASPSGDYADTDFILCAKATNPDVPLLMFQSPFIQYGSIVYQFATPEDLGQAILARDPSSTLDAVALYQDELARQAAQDAGTLVPTNPVPISDPPVQPDPAISPDPNAGTAPDTASTQSEVADLPASPSDTTASSTDSSLTPLDGGDLTSPQATADNGAVYTPPATPPIDVSSTTPAIAVSSTTPAITSSTTTPPVDISTTTPAVDLSTTTPE